MNMRNTAFFWTAVVAWIIGGCAPTSGRGDTFADPVSRVDNKAKMLELPAYDKSEHVLEYDGFTVVTLANPWKDGSAELGCL